LFSPTHLITRRSTTYLFIRKSLNPENAGINVSKFVPDAYCGGIAAFVGVILKKVLVKQLGV
jgi:hypothetical protein